MESLDKHILDSARMMGLSTPTMIFQVLLPYLYPTVATGLKTQLPTAMLMLVMAEMYGATSGLGYFVINYTTTRTTRRRRRALSWSGSLSPFWTSWWGFSFARR